MNRNLIAVIVTLSFAALRAQVPAVPLQSAIAANGALTVAAVDRGGSVGPFAPFDIRGVAIGSLAACQSPAASLSTLLVPGWEQMLDSAERLGVNTIRLYGMFPPPATAGPTAVAFMDRCFDLGLRVLFTTPAWTPGNFASFASMQGQVSSSVAAWASHPALLGFVVLNEWSLQPGPGGTINTAAILTLIPEVQAMAALIKATDPNRVVFSSLHEQPDFQFLFNTHPALPTGQTWASWITQNTPAVDVYGLNLYRSDSPHPYSWLWEQQAPDKTYAIFEASVDALNGNASTTTAASELWQRDHLIRVWDVHQRLATGPFSNPRHVGAIAFALADEFWKNVSPCTQDPSYNTTTITYPSLVYPGFFSYAADPDGVRSEEYLGLNSLSGAWNLSPRPAYNALASRNANEASLTSTQWTLSVLSRGYWASGGGLNNGYVAVSVDGNTIWHACGGCVGGGGLSIVQFARDTGAITQKQTIYLYTFNGSGASAALSAIGAIPTGTLCALGVADTFHPFWPPQTMAPPWSGPGGLIAAIQARFGATLLTSAMPYQSGWALVGYADAAAPLAEVAPLPGPSGAVTATATIDYDLDRDGIPDATDPDDDNDGITDAYETLVRSDPLDPVVLPLTLHLSTNPTGSLLLDVLQTNPSTPIGNALAQIDPNSIELQVITPAPASLVPYLATIFTPATPPAAGLRLQTPPVPAGLNIRVVARIRFFSGRVIQDAIAIP